MRAPSETELQEFLERKAREYAAGPAPKVFDEARARAIREGIWRRNMRLAEADPTTGALRLERLRQRLTIRDLAKRAKMARATVALAELHPERSESFTWGRLSKALGVHVDSIRP